MSGISLQETRRVRCCVMLIITAVIVIIVVAFIYHHYHHINTIIFSSLLLFHHIIFHFFVIVIKISRIYCATFHSHICLLVIAYRPRNATITNPCPALFRFSRCSRRERRSIEADATQISLIAVESSVVKRRRFAVVINAGIPLCLANYRANWRIYSDGGAYGAHCRLPARLFAIADGISD